MQYFTPELHARTCSENDAIADAAHAEWEKALERYEKHLAKMRPAFTPGVRMLAEKLRLHDAELMFLGRGKNRCVLTLHTDSPSGEVVSLEYELAGDPVIKHDALPAAQRTRNGLFLYDELDASTGNGHKVFSHTILFTNGLLLRVRFREVTIRLMELLLGDSKRRSRKPVRQPA